MKRILLAGEGCVFLYKRHIINIVRPRIFNKWIIFIFSIMFIVLSSRGNILNIHNRDISKADSIHQLFINDTIPNYLWNLPVKSVDSFNKISKVSLSKYKDKLIVLDFWATWCIPCIQSFSFLNELQHQYNGKIQILPITDQSENLIKNATSITPQLINNQLPLIIEDDLKRGIAGFFPKRTVPHLVWIKDNKVLAITDHEELNSLNINKILKGEEVNLQSKFEDLSFDAKKPFLINGNGGDSQDFIYRSIFADRKVGLPSFSSIYKDTLNNTISISIINGTILNAWQYKFPRKESFSNNRISFPSGYEFLRNYIFCYQLNIQNDLEHKAVDLLIHDMENFFGIKASITNKTSDCLILTDASMNEKYLKTDYSIPTLSSFSVKGKEISSIISWLNNTDVNMPYVTIETSSKKLPKSDFKGGDSLSELNSWLAESGLVLIPVKRKLEFLEFSIIN